jgi:hypothetical protein
MMAEPVRAFRSRRLAVTLATVIAISFFLAHHFAGRGATAASPPAGSLTGAATKASRVAAPSDPDEITKVYAKYRGKQTPAVHVFQTGVRCRIEVKGKTDTDRVVKLRVRNLATLTVVDTLYGVIRKHKKDVEIHLDPTYALHHLGPGGTVVSYGLEAILNARQNNGNLYVEPKDTAAGPGLVPFHLPGLTIYIAKDAPTSCGPDPTSTFTPNQPLAYSKVTLFGDATENDTVTVTFHDITDPDNWVAVTPNIPTTFTILQNTNSNRGLIDNTGNTAANGPLYLPTGASFRVMRMQATVTQGTAIKGISAGTYEIRP